MLIAICAGVGAIVLAIGILGGLLVLLNVLVDWWEDFYDDDEDVL